MSSKTPLRPTQLPIQWRAGVLFLGIKLSDREADHSPLSSAEVKNSGATIPPSNMSSWNSAQLIKHSDTFKISCIYRKFKFMNSLVFILITTIITSLSAFVL
jgi:hypothetical protein